MYAISYFVGSKFGGWIVGSKRYSEREIAQLVADSHESDEHCAGASKFLRRVVRV